MFKAARLDAHLSDSANSFDFESLLSETANSKLSSIRESLLKTKDHISNEQYLPKKVFIKQPIKPLQLTNPNRPRLREELSKGYKRRVSKFIEQLAIQPVPCLDDYNEARRVSSPEIETLNRFKAHRKQL
jgi:hypothetical protein